MKDEDRRIELIDEMWAMLDSIDEEGRGMGTFLRACADKCLEAEREERAALLAFADQVGAPKVLIDLIERGAHRKRSSAAMQAIRDVRGTLAEDRQKLVDEALQKYVKGEP